MKRHLLGLMLVAPAVFLAPAFAGEVPIGSFDHGGSGSSFSSTFGFPPKPKMFFYVIPSDHDDFTGNNALGSNVIWDDDSPPKFDSVDFFPGDQGFDLLEEYLTNGFDDRIAFWVMLTNGGGVGASVLESAVFSDVDEVDLAGYELTRIQLDVHDFHVDQFEQDDLFFTEFSAATTWTFYVVPEPSTLVLLLVGMGVLKRRYRKQPTPIVLDV